MANKDFRFHVGLTPRMWVSFKMLATESNFESFTKYYKALSTWVKEHKKLFGDSILKDFRLDILIELNPNNCDINETMFSLEMEHERMFGGEKPKYLEVLAQRIGNTLWDLVTVYSGMDCPNCIYDDGLRYVMTIKENTRKRKLALKCESCGHLQTLCGKIFLEEKLQIIPASREDIAESNEMGV